MALSLKHDKVCTICGRQGTVKETMLLCYECHGYHCEECSYTHSQESEDHIMIPLTTEKSTRVEKLWNSTSSLESNIDVTEDDVLHRRETDDIESLSDLSEPVKPTKYMQPDPTRLTATKCLEFKVTRPEDEKKSRVPGLLCVSDKVVVVDLNNYGMKLFDHSGTHLSSTITIHETLGLTHVHDKTFATCVFDKRVCLWTVRGQKIVSEDVSYHVDDWAHGINYNGIYYCVLHNLNNAITVLDRQGKQVRKILVNEACGIQFKFGWDIHMDSDTNNIYVSCRHQHGVLCMTIEGYPHWFTSLSCPTLGFTEIQGALCVADFIGVRLYLINKEGEKVRTLLDEKDLGGEPGCLCYGLDGKLYISYAAVSDKKDTISVYKIT